MPDTNTLVYLASSSATKKKVYNIDYRCQFHQYFMSSFLYESYCAAFMCLQFWFVIFWQKDFGAKAAHKILVKLIPDCKIIRCVCSYNSGRRIYDQFYDFLKCQIIAGRVPGFELLGVWSPAHRNGQSFRRVVDTGGANNGGTDPERKRRKKKTFSEDFSEQN